MTSSAAPRVGHWNVPTPGLSFSGAVRSTSLCPYGVTEWRICWRCFSRSGLSRAVGSMGHRTGGFCHLSSQSDLLTHRGSLGPLQPEHHSPVSTLPISTKSRSTTEPSRYPKAGPNTAMAKRMAGKGSRESPCEQGMVVSMQMWILSSQEMQGETTLHHASEGPHCPNTVFLTAAGGVRQLPVEKVPLLCCHQGFADTIQVVSHTMDIHDIHEPQGQQGSDILGSHR